MCMPRECQFLAEPLLKKVRPSEVVRADTSTGLASVSLLHATSRRVRSGDTHASFVESHDFTKGKERSCACLLRGVTRDDPSSDFRKGGDAEVAALHRRERAQSSCALSCRACWRGTAGWAGKPSEKDVVGRGHGRNSRQQVELWGQLRVPAVLCTAN